VQPLYLRAGASFGFLSGAAAVVLNNGGTLFPQLDDFFVV
jgi:hypothetical protein